ncbi:putative folate-biopterin transporter 7 isoform X2 [Primulina tabacum]|uniref:putative folate-biopterin transporter 7 isoform X2 n=1 Tax=Primulina tabacum TaxID=48773 RepID=UPI003F595D94
MVSRESEIDRNRKLLLGIGYWVQGLRCFPWMGVNFFLKDGLKMDPSTLQILQNSANLPMVAKPFYGILSDSFYISGQHRVPYIAIGETGRKPTSSKNVKSSSSGALQSFTWMASSIGGVLGNLIAGISIGQFSPRMMFLIFGILLCFQFLVTMFVSEDTLDLPKSPSNVGFKKQLSELMAALQKPEIFYSIIWFALSYAVIPALTGTMFYYQTEHLNIKSSLLGISKVFGQAAMLLWGVVYNRHLKSISGRKLIAVVQISMAVFMISDFLFVKGVYKSIGIPDSLYVVVFSGLLEVLYFFKILPFNVLMAQLCPPGYEGSVMAFVMSAIALAFIVSGYLGVALASLVGITGDNFQGLPRGLLIQAACTILPVFWVSCIPDDQKSSTTKRKES